MTAEKIKKEIASLTNDVQFDYKGYRCFIDPYNAHKFVFVYKDMDKIYTDIDFLMNDKVFDGKSLSEIAPEIQLL